MKLKAVSGIMLTLLFIGTLTLTFNTKLVKASGTIYIRADGSVDPYTAPISSADGITYTFTNNIYDSIVVERDNIVVDGAGYTVQGAGSETGIELSGRSKVTIKNIEIKAFNYGIWLSGASNNIIQANKITANAYQGIRIRDYSNNNIVSRNSITNNYFGIWITDSSDNSVCRNDITNNMYGVRICYCAPNNKVYHNNFMDNTVQAYSYNSMGNVWIDGYPSGGNYWSDYAGVDLYSGPYQNETGSDGIGDTPYVIDADNQDRYPLMNPWTPGIAVMNVTPSRSIVVEGSTLGINVTVTNQGIATETFNLTAYADQRATVIGDETTIGIQNVTLAGGNSTTVTFTWNTTGVGGGDYTISAKASVVPGETDTIDNTKVDGTVTVFSTGHDVAIKGVNPSKTVVGQGCSLLIHMTAKNYGNFTETFNVTAYYDDIPIKTENVTNLLPREETIVTFTWNTTGISYGNHTISANATIVLGETDTTDNTYTDSWIFVTVLGDLNGDCKVGSADIILLGKSILKKPGDSTYNPTADLNGDGKIGASDIIILGKHILERCTP